MDPLLILVIVLIVLFAAGNAFALGNVLYLLLVVAVIVLLVRMLQGERL